MSTRPSDLNSGQPESAAFVARIRRSATRHPLETLEIFDLVCEFLGSPGRFSLALTCRAFEEPAMRVLWRELVSWEPLLQSLPPDIWTPVSGTDDPDDDQSLCVRRITQRKNDSF